MEKRDVVDKIVQYIKTQGGKAYKTDGNYKPDIFGCLYGKCLAIECKDTGKLKELTEGQEIELRNWYRAGAIAFVTDSLEHAATVLEFARQGRFKYGIR